MADSSAENRKLFVGGLAWETTDASLREAFERYGRIEEGQYFSAPFLDIGRAASTRPRLGAETDDYPAVSRPVLHTYLFGPGTRRSTRHGQTFAIGSVLEIALSCVSYRKCSVSCCLSVLCLALLDPGRLWFSALLLCWNVVVSDGHDEP
jgi:RNA recognition motif-containing protein